MSNEWEEFVRYIFHEHIERRLALSHPFFHHHLEDYDYRLSRLLEATRALRFISDFARNDEDTLSIFTPEMLRRTVAEVRNGTVTNAELVVRTGIVDIIQDYFKEIVDGMSVDHFPEQDLTVLRQSGSTDPRGEIKAMVFLVKSRKEQLLFEGQEVCFGHRLEEAIGRIERIEGSLPGETKEPSQSNRRQAVKRATFKGIGSIAQGALMTITNVSLAAGFWKVPLPPETTSVGAVVSITSGIGTILTGIGELRGE